MKIHIKNFTVGTCLPLALVLSGLSFPKAAHSQAPTAAGSSAGTGGPTDHRPKKYSPLRYFSIHTNSAFEREILPPEKPDGGPPPTPFDRKIVSVTGKDGRYRVVLIDKKGKYQVVTEEPDADGFHYSDIEPSAKIQDFRVQVSKGGQTEWAEFDTKRYSLASKKITPPKAPANNARRPAVVPNNRTPPPGRRSGATAAAATPAAKAAAQKSGAAAQAAIQSANASAVKASEAKSRVNGRRVVLPPKNR
ncbi:MAG: hypothetical protein ACR2RV_00690 [Verrucomicrobiales bacterium]